ncbi:MAG TPA: MraY family glycosyltransferase [Baekduia sp.]|nr:MraY family glycosyltransferase [Baekduia sp.]
MQHSGWDAAAAAAVAAALSAALTPVSARFARRVGAVDQPRGRGLADRPTPLLGGLAIFAGVLVASLIWLPVDDARWQAILAGAAVITLVGALDDVFDLHWAVKLLGQATAALLPVLKGVRVESFTLPFVHRVELGTDLGVVLTVLGLVLVMNTVNFSDGIDGLAAGVCAIAAASFSIIAFDLQRGSSAVLAAIIAGAALGFLVHNFPPASSFMGDCGALLLGYLLGVVAVEGTVKTQAVLALFLPLVVLAVPFLDTTFVVLKRLKYRRPVYAADANHFHHRFTRIGFSQRRTVLYLYAWTLLLGGSAVALRFVPYSDNGGRLHAGWSIVMGLILLVVVAASVYLVFVLEILKFRRLNAVRLRRLRPDADQHEIDADSQRRMETGEFEAVRRETEEFGALGR